jgi:hypothetical protein
MDRVAQRANCLQLTVASSGSWEATLDRPDGGIYGSEVDFTAKQMIASIVAAKNSEVMAAF